MIWKQFLYNFIGVLNGPVKNALFCFMDRYQNVCVWFMARSCRVPEVETHASQPGNHGLPLQGTSGSWSWNSWFPTWEPQVTIARNCRFRDLETYGSQPGNQRLPFIARNCRFPDVRIYVFEAKRLSLQGCGFPKLETHGSKPEKVTLRVEGSVDCKQLELMVLHVVLFCLLSG